MPTADIDYLKKKVTADDYRHERRQAVALKGAYQQLEAVKRVLGFVRAVYGQHWCCARVSMHGATGHLPGRCHWGISAWARDTHRDKTNRGKNKQTDSG